MSLNTHTNVDTQQLDITEMNIENSLQVAERAIESLDAAIIGKLLPAWKGEASSQFFSNYVDDLQGFREFIRVLRCTNEQLSQDSIAYDRAESRVLENINALRVG